MNLCQHFTESDPELTQEEKWKQNDKKGVHAHDETAAIAGRIKASSANHYVCMVYIV
jgi:hypothetical protein